MLASFPEPSVQYSLPVAKNKKVVGNMKDEAYGRIIVQSDAEAVFIYCKLKEELS